MKLESNDIFSSIKFENFKEELQHTAGLKSRISELTEMLETGNYDKSEKKELMTELKVLKNALNDI